MRRPRRTLALTAGLLLVPFFTMGSRADPQRSDHGNPAAPEGKPRDEALLQLVAEVLKRLDESAHKPYYYFRTLRLAADAQAKLGDKESARATLRRVRAGRGYCDTVGVARSEYSHLLREGSSPSTISPVRSDASMACGRDSAMEPWRRSQRPKQSRATRRRPERHSDGPSWTPALCTRTNLLRESTCRRRPAENKPPTISGTHTSPWRSPRSRR